MENILSRMPYERAINVSYIYNIILLSYDVHEAY